jgi:[acyl-carrier-protein] S-malonyltransferase
MSQEFPAPRGDTDAQRLIAPGRVALVFPGQGAQYVGMGRDLCEQYAVARAVFEQAEAVLGFSLSELCFHGPEEDLNDTANAQPAIVTMSMAALEVLRERLGGKLAPVFVAGHSLGEYTAWLAAGVLDLPASLRLVRERGRVMREAGERYPGAMAAVLGMDVAALQAVCDEVGDVWLANDNSPGQIVLSGSKPALERALQLASARGAKKTVLLAVSIAGHSPLMASAADAFAPTVNQVPLARAEVPVIANVTALPLAEPAEIRHEMLQHLTAGVRWVDSVRYMIDHGVQTFVEVGPKDVLCGLIRRIDRTLPTPPNPADSAGRSTGTRDAVPRRAWDAVAIAATQDGVPSVRTVHVGTVSDVEALGA